ncbi:MAG: hypothetical protein LBR56_03550 [Sporomusaceae bacterium]|jgi:hypothetical protein|nr:hypothetical protein [Sporomusaceae bacterium]
MDNGTYNKQKHDENFVINEKNNNFNTKFKKYYLINLLKKLFSWINATLLICGIIVTALGGIIVAIFANAYQEPPEESLLSPNHSPE